MLVEQKAGDRGEEEVVDVGEGGKAMRSSAYDEECDGPGSGGFIAKR